MQADPLNVTGTSVIVKSMLFCVVEYHELQTLLSRRRLDKYGTLGGKHCLSHHVLARPREQEIPQVGHRAQFHLSFRVLRGCPHVRQQHVLRKRAQPGVHPRFVGEHVQTDRRQLCHTVMP